MALSALRPSFTPHHHKYKQKGIVTGSGSFIQENIERKLKTFVKVSELSQSQSFSDFMIEYVYVYMSMTSD